MRAKEAPGRRPGPARKALLAGMAVGLGLLGLEGALRLRQWIRYGTSAELIRLVPDTETGLEIPEPGSVSGPIVIDSRGFRSPELDVPKPPGRVRLAVLGGSTSFCAEVSGNEATWPMVLLEGLRTAHPDVAFDLVNAGVPGYTTVQSLVNLRQRVAPLEPDVVLVYHAKNDLKHEAHERAMAQGVLDPARAKDTEESWSLAWNLFWKNWRFRQRRSGEVARPLAFEPADLAVPFRRDLRALLEEAEEVAPLAVVATFAIQLRADQPRDQQLAAAATSLYYMPYLDVEGLLAAFDEFNRVIREVAGETGVLLIEAEGALPGDATCFADAVHFNDEGCRRMATLVQRALEADAGFQALLAR